MEYDQFAPAYAAHRRADDAVIEALVAGARITARSRVLEVGAGTGNYGVTVAERTGATCAGVEPSAAMREVARARGADVRAGAAEALPFADADFDTVVFVDVVHHLADVGAALREAARVVRPGGTVCLVTDDEASIRGRLHALYFPETVAVELHRYPTVDALRAAALAAGLEPGRVERTSTPYTVTDARPYRELAFSSLALIPEAARRAGLERLERALERGPVSAVDRHVLTWAARPA